MARQAEEFNPWPAFVDLFASIIMVVLMFLLVLIVNVAFYAQYKYKISYTGSVPIDELLQKESIQEELEREQLENQDEKKQSSDSEIVIEDKSEDVIESNKTSGVELTTPDHNFTRQENLINLDWMLIKFMQNELILDPTTIEELESFIESAKVKFANHSIEIFISEPKKQVSATVARQIGLSRALNVRNIVRSLNYKNDEVLVRLRKTVPEAQSIEHDAGYIVVSIMKKGK